MLKFANNWGGLTSENRETWDALWAEHGTLRGPCKSVGAEMIRAMDRICYRFYNDGDTVRRYYGGTYNYLIVCDDFLYQHCDGYEEMKNITDRYLKYEEILVKNMNRVARYLSKHPELFQEENHTDCTEGGPLAQYDDEDYEDEEDEGWDDDDI